MLVLTLDVRLGNEVGCLELRQPTAKHVGGGNAPQQLAAWAGAIDRDPLGVGDICRVEPPSVKTQAPTLMGSDNLVSSCGAARTVYSTRRSDQRPTLGHKYARASRRPGAMERRSRHSGARSAHKVVALRREPSTATSSLLMLQTGDPSLQLASMGRSMPSWTQICSLGPPVSRMWPARWAALTDLSMGPKSSRSSSFWL